MLATLRNTVATAHASGTFHSEFWGFVAGVVATYVVIRQASQPISWPFVFELIAYMAIVASSATAIKILAVMKRGVSNGQE